MRRGGGGEGGLACRRETGRDKESVGRMEQRERGKGEKNEMRGETKDKGRRA